MGEEREGPGQPRATQILVAEHDRGERELFAWAIRGTGLRVVEIETAAQLEDRLASGAFDAVIVGHLGASRAARSALDVVRRCSASVRGKVILIVNDNERMSPVGLAAVLRKPVDIEVLRERVRSLAWEAHSDRLRSNGARVPAPGSDDESPPAG